MFDVYASITERRQFYYKFGLEFQKFFLSTTLTVFHSSILE